MFQPRLFILLTAFALAVALNGCGGSSGMPPSITAQPQDQTVRAGFPATFSVVASGTMPLNYQWMKNGMAIQGANSASYTTPPTMPSDNNSNFAVVVSNNSGSVTSNTATLTVMNVP